jgi:hypothetical protein
MTDGVSTQGQTSNRIRFARIAAGAAFVFAVIGLSNASLPLEAAGAVCALFAAVFATLARDIYAGAGSLVAVVIVATSPAVATFISSYSAQQQAAQEAQSAQVTADIAEVEQYDARLAGYQGADPAAVDRMVVAFGHATDQLSNLRDRYRLAFDPNERGNIRNTMIAVRNDVEAGQSKLRTIKSTMDQKLAESPAKWSHTQDLCRKPNVRDADVCGRLARDHELYLQRVQQALAAMDRMTAAYNAEQPKQQAIFDSVS